jgi:hypothetical protein
MKVEIGFFRPFLSVFIPRWDWVCFRVWYSSVEWGRCMGLDDLFFCRAYGLSTNKFSWPVNEFSFPAWPVRQLCLRVPGQWIHVGFLTVRISFLMGFFQPSGFRERFMSAQLNS